MTDQSQAERDFLLAYLIAAHTRGGAGASATALIITAFTGRDPDRWPADTADLERCERAYEAAPLHLRMFMAPWLQKFHAHVHQKARAPACSRPGCWQPRAIGEEFCEGCAAEGYMDGIGE